MRKSKKAIRVPLLFSILFLLAAFAAPPLAGAAGKSVPVVTAGKTVKVNYTLKVDGKVVDSSKGKPPLEFKAGSHEMIPGFEKAVMGMKLGEKKSFKVSPEEGYGKVNPKAIQEIPKSKLPPNIKPAPGMMLSASTPDGHHIPVRVVSVKKDTIVLDFNPPLAGKTLNFDVEVVGIK
ncbi:MAG: peptidylprolyl isomerase [Nitrospiraceae bacterium]|nr:peptidylprolyl isomerase [Nitrospiraceae bacterium]